MTATRCFDRSVSRVRIVVECPCDYFLIIRARAGRMPILPELILPRSTRRNDRTARTFAGDGEQVARVRTCAARQTVFRASERLRRILFTAFFGFFITVPASRPSNAQTKTSHRDPCARVIHGENILNRTKKKK